MAERARASRYAFIFYMDRNLPRRPSFCNFIETNQATSPNELFLFRLTLCFPFFVFLYNSFFMPDRPTLFWDALSQIYLWFDSFFALPLSECQSYTSLTGADRKITYYNVRDQCDGRSLGTGWYRFQGAAGTRMPTSCPPYNRCDTDATGWLNGRHPTVADGQVTRQVCFHWTSGCCEWSTNIQVRNCGSFYVYYFNGTPTCALRYCGTD